MWSRSLIRHSATPRALSASRPHPRSRNPVVYSQRCLNKYISISILYLPSNISCRPHTIWVHARCMHSLLYSVIIHYDTLFISNSNSGKPWLLNADHHEKGEGYKRRTPSRLSGRDIILKLASTLHGKFK